jgi:ABC-type uncharacterized transport system substrate-binding protein
VSALSIKRCSIAAIASAAAALHASQSIAHPHVFAEANLEVSVDANGTVTGLRHVWRFDDLFSSTVLLEFDANADLQLDDSELDEVGSVIHESLAEFGYFQFVTADNRDVEMRAPDRIMALFDNNQLTVLFESQPKDPLALTGTIDFGVYDPTFYTAIDFFEDDSLTVTGLPVGCTRQVVRPDPDEAIAQNQQSLTEAFFDDPSGNDMSQMFATRLELTCTGAG